MEESGGPYGIMCAHVDDLCFSGNDQFQKQVISQLSDRLKVGTEESKHFRYLGVDGGDNQITMD